MPRRQHCARQRVPVAAEQDVPRYSRHGGLGKQQGYYTVALNIDWPSTHMVAATRTALPLRERPTPLPGCRRPLSRSLWYLPLRHRQTSRGRSPAQRSRTWCERNAYGAGLAPNSNSHQVRFFGWFDTVSSTTVPAAHIRLLTRTTPCVATKEVHAFTAGAPA